MAQSQYLVQALQSMGQQPQGQTYQAPNLAQMQQMAQRRQAWDAANPGQSYMMHGLYQLGQDAMNAPGNVVKGLGNLAGAPGNAAGGFMNMIRGLPGMTPQPAQYGGVPIPSNLG